MQEWEKGDYRITTDPLQFDRDVIFEFLARQAYWSRNIPHETMEKSLANSLGFALFHRDQQVGFVRVISDYATIAYLGDVFVIPEFRGRGLSKWLMECVMSHPDLQSLLRWILVTGDAHELYKKFGFAALAKPESYMELYNPEVYTRKRSR
jgi:GNAT superfamily N-acetyltransferase